MVRTIVITLCLAVSFTACAVKPQPVQPAPSTSVQSTLAQDSMQQIEAAIRAKLDE